jgi:hypothetical protein
MIAFSLINQELDSKVLVTKFDDSLKSYDKVSQLTELLTFQIISCLLRRNEFSKENIIKYINHYTELIKKDQVRERSIFILVSQIRKKFTDEKDKDMQNFYKKTMDEFKTLGNAMKK